VAENKPEKKKKGCLGCSLPVLIFFIVLTVALLVVGFLSGALGQSLIKGLNVPSWLKVPPPEVALPAEAVFHIGSFAVTNTILTSWISIALIAIILITLSSKSKIIPGKFQSIMEQALEWVLNLCKDVAGEKNGTRFFPIIVTIFLFVLFNAWLAILPGFGSIQVHEGGIVFPLLRGANTDINTPLAIALISFVFVEFLGFSSNGFHYLKKFLNFGHFFRAWGDVFRGKVKAGCGGVLFGIIDIFVGFLELISEFVRIVSFTFRLFGNMTGGEILVLTVLFLIPFLVVLPVYGLELLVGAVQALIFSGLTLVFAAMAAAPHEEEHHA
jgi:F-type H+-transporting ATPase subunit a